MTTLSSAAIKLRDFLSDISEDVYAAGWMADCEWDIWSAYQEWKAGRPAKWSFADISAYMAELEQLHREAGGWIWWLDHRGGEQFVADARWALLVAERAKEGGRISNEQLDARLAGDSGEEG